MTSGPSRDSEQYIRCPTEDAVIEKSAEEAEKLSSKTCSPRVKETSHSNLKTLLALSFAFFFAFTSYFGTEALQSSVNPDGGMGVISLGILYGTFVVSCPLVGPLAVCKLTPKWSLFSAWFGYFVYVASNLYSRWWTLYPAAMLTGLAGGLVWISQGVYTTTLALNEAGRTGADPEAQLGSYNGIFYCAFSATHVVGNLMSFLVLSFQETAGASLDDVTDANWTLSQPSWNVTQQPPDVVNWFMANGTAAEYRMNSSVVGREEYGKPPSPSSSSSSASQSVCGANHCPYLSAHKRSIQRPEQKLVYIIMGCYLLSMVVGMVITFFIPNLETRQRKVAVRDRRSHLRRLKKTFMLFTEWRLLLLVPSLLQAGAFPGVAVGSFTQSFINCALGVRWVGLVMLCRGFSFSVSCYVSGKIVKWLKRATIMTFTFGLHLAALAAWFLWQPDASSKWQFFIVAAVEGAGSGSLRVQCGALIGFLFADHQETAFAHQNIWNGLAMTCLLITGNVLCFRTKALFLLSLCSISVISYITLETILFFRARKKKNGKS